MKFLLPDYSIHVYSWTNGHFLSRIYPACYRATVSSKGPLEYYYSLSQSHSQAVFVETVDPLLVNVGILPTCSLNFEVDRRGASS
jgi:hypothetical protein